MEGIKRINIDKEKPMGAVAQIRIDQTRLVMGISIRKIKRGQIMLVELLGKTI